MERRGPAIHDFFANKGGRGEMTKAPGSDDLRAIPNPMARPIPDIAVKTLLVSLISG